MLPFVARGGAPCAGLCGHAVCTRGARATGLHTSTHAAPRLGRRTRPRTPDHLEGTHTMTMNLMADLPAPTSTEAMVDLLTALNGLRRGDASMRLPVTWEGLPGKVADAFNDVVERNAHMAAELARLR